MDIRLPTVAGAFYPAEKRELESLIFELFSYWGLELSKRKAENAKAFLMPHAGYIYSGYVAAKAYYLFPDVKTVAILGPNHTGLGADFAVSSADAWETPLGRVSVDTKACRKLTELSSRVELDETAHLGEHSIEVQLPFLQTVLPPGFKIIPICIKGYYPDDEFLSACTELGHTLAKVLPKDSAIVASSDMSHYVPASLAKENDSLAIKELIKMDVPGLFSTIAKNNISMCGYSAAAPSIIAAKDMGVKSAKEIAYMTSGDVTGDQTSVVGYASVEFR